jgi:acetylornithine deacetylase
MINNKRRIAHAKFASRRAVISGGAACLITGLVCKSTWATEPSISAARGAEQDAYRAIAESVDMEKVIRWALELADFYSPTGQEGAVGEYLYKEYRKLGLEAKLLPVGDARHDAVGYLPGSGGGHALMFNGHLDTFPVNRPGELYEFGGSATEPARRFATPKVVDKHWLYGQEIMNMKSGIAAYLGAVDAIVRSGIRLKGDIVIVGVVGADPKSSWTQSGPPLPGDEIGIGTKYLLGHGQNADMCILGEPTSLKVALAPFGRARMKVVLGSVHAKILTAEMNKVVTAIAEWIPRYQSAHEFKRVLPDVTVVAASCRNNQPLFDNLCEIYLEFRTIPGQAPLSVVEALREFLGQIKTAGSESTITVEPLMLESATEVSADVPIVRALRAAHEKIAHASAPIINIGWSGDANRLNQSGIPTVIYGPGGRAPEGTAFPDSLNFQSIDDLSIATRTYAMAAADLCSRARSS